MFKRFKALFVALFTGILKRCVEDFTYLQ